MSDKLHNLDEGVEETFKFQLLGHIYTFRQPNTEELNQIRSFEDGEDIKLIEYLSGFITGENKDVPTFKEAQKKMIAPHWTRFKEMLRTELGG